jgi:hypothetical protein
VEDVVAVHKERLDVAARDFFWHHVRSANEDIAVSVLWYGNECTAVVR